MTFISRSIAVAAPPPADARLVARAREGHADALAALYERYAAVILAAAYRFTLSRADAQDVLHDVFLGLPERLARYEERGQFPEWLRRVAVRATLTHMRASRRRSEVPLVPEMSAADAAGDVVARSVIERQIAALGEPLRVVFVLKAVEGYSHAEIADLLGISVGASAVRFHRAVRVLRRTLAGRL